MLPSLAPPAGLAGEISCPFMVKLLLLLHRFSRIQLCDLIDGSPPGSPVPGILKARTLEWVAISFSNAWKWKVKVKSLSPVRPSATPWTAAFQAPLSMGFSRQEYWSGVPLPSPHGQARSTNCFHVSREHVPRIINLLSSLARMWAHTTIVLLFGGVSRASVRRFCC